MPGSADLQWAMLCPGIMAAALCLLNMVFVARYLKESRDPSEHEPDGREASHFSPGYLAGDLAFE